MTQYDYQLSLMQIQHQRPCHVRYVRKDDKVEHHNIQHQLASSKVQVARIHSTLSKTLCKRFTCPTYTQAVCSELPSMCQKVFHKCQYRSHETNNGSISRNLCFIGKRTLNSSNSNLCHNSKDKKLCFFSNNH